MVTYLNLYEEKETMKSLSSVPTSLKFYSHISREFLLAQKYALVDILLCRTMA